MFHLLRLNTALSLLLSLSFTWLAEMQSIRDDREANVTLSMLQQYWHLATAMHLMCEAFATFR